MHISTGPRVLAIRFPDERLPGVVASPLFPATLRPDNQAQTPAASGPPAVPPGPLSGPGCRLVTPASCWPQAELRPESEPLLLRAAALPLGSQAAASCSHNVLSLAAAPSQPGRPASPAPGGRRTTPSCASRLGARPGRPTCHSRHGGLTRSHTNHRSHGGSGDRKRVM